MVDFNAAMARLLWEISRNLPELQHICMDHVLVSAAFNRSRRRAGLLAYVLPLKYRAGSPVERRVRGSREYHWAMLPLRREGREILYIIYFMLPRYLHLGLREQLETAVHELYHIGPQFNGDLRRFKGRSVLHGSLREYDRKVASLTDRFLAGPHDRGAYAFLPSLRPHTPLQAVHIPEPRPKLLKVAQYPPAEPLNPGLPSSVSGLVPS